MLAKKEAMLTAVNFNTKEMVKEPQVFDGEFLTKFRNEPIDVVGIITSDHLWSMGAFRDLGAGVGVTGLDD